MNYSELLGIEDNKWDESNKQYGKYLEKLGEFYAKKVESSEMQITEIPSRMIADGNCYIGDAKLANTIYKYELYKKVMNLSGDIAEVGIFRGDSFLFWAKLVKIFEPYNLTQVYGFDWFKGMEPGENDDQYQKGKYTGGGIRTYRTSSHGKNLLILP